MMVPRRIVSLVPSLTELVCWLGRGDALAGRTRFCTEPPAIVARVPVIGGTKNPRIARIIDIQPDLVIANREENRFEDVQALQTAGLDVLVTDPDTVGEALEMVAELGRRLDTESRAAQLIAATRAAIDCVRPARVRVFTAVWKEPLMGLGAATYGHDLLRLCGAENVLADEERYPETTVERVTFLQPDLILLPDEPYPFTESDTQLFGGSVPVRVIDGKQLWWYGPRMPAAIEMISALLGAVSSAP